MYSIIRIFYTHYHVHIFQWKVLNFLKNKTFFGFKVFEMYDSLKWYVFMVKGPNSFYALDLKNLFVFWYVCFI